MTGFRTALTRAINQYAKTNNLLKEKDPSISGDDVLDIARDPRWGRTEETYGESPYLAARLGVAYVRGVQGDIGGTVYVLGNHRLIEERGQCSPALEAALRPSRGAPGC